MCKFCKCYFKLFCLLFIVFDVPCKAFVFNSKNRLIILRNKQILNLVSCAVIVTTKSAVEIRDFDKFLVKFIFFFFKFLDELFELPSLDSPYTEIFLLSRHLFSLNFKFPCFRPFTPYDSVIYGIRQSILSVMITNDHMILYSPLTVIQESFDRVVGFLFPCDSASFWQLS